MFSSNPSIDVYSQALVTKIKNNNWWFTAFSKGKKVRDIIAYGMDYHHLPGHPTAIELAATVRVTDDGQFNHWEFLFRLSRGDKIWHMSNADFSYY